MKKGIRGIASFLIEADAIVPGAQVSLHVAESPAMELRQLAESAADDISTA